jgi:small subunit ribosomal protein S6
MANYELLLILNPSLWEEEKNLSLDNLKALFKKAKVKIEKEDIWGDRKLAYKINGSEKGFYALFDLELDWKLIKDLSKSINLDRNIWRYMFTRKED